MGACDRLGRDGGQFIADVGLQEGAATNAGSLESIQMSAQIGSVADSADNQEGMLGRGREKGPSGLDGGVTGLDGLLRPGQIPPHQHVDIRPASNLVTHGIFLS